MQKKIPLEVQESILSNRPRIDLLFILNVYKPMAILTNKKPKNERKKL